LIIFKIGPNMFKFLNFCLSIKILRRLKTYHNHYAKHSSFCACCIL